MYAAMNGNIEMMKVLIEYGENINETDSSGQTPIFFAARSSNTEAIDFLISQGANVNIKDRDGKTYKDIIPT